MEDTEKQKPTQWFVFFKDQLLLKKEKTEKGEIGMCQKQRNTCEIRKKMK